MRLRLWLIPLIQAVLVIGLLLGLRSGLMPLGIPGEWQWMRLPAWATPVWEWLLLAAGAVIAYAAFAAWGLRVLGAGASRWTEPVWLGGLFVMAIAIQVIVPTGAPSGYDLTKWASVNYLASSTGYFKIAREQAGSDPWKFLSEYPRWIRSQDSLHIGTHPPGLIATQCFLLQTMKANPGLVKVLLDGMPTSVEAGFRVFAADDPRPLLPAERAALYATALLTLLACAGTVLPLYLLVRSVLPARAAWVAAALWPLAPAANLFQPVADTAYPFLSTLALALTAWSARLQGGSSRPRFRAPAPRRRVGLGDGIWHLLYHGVLAGGAHGRNHGRLDVRDRLANARPPDPGDGRGLFGPGTLRLRGRRRQSVRDRDVEPASSCPVLRRISPHVSPVALGQSRRAGGRDRPAIGRVLSARPLEPTEGSGLFLGGAPGAGAGRT